MDGRAHTRNLSASVGSHRWSHALIRALTQDLTHDRSHTLSRARTNPGWLSPQDPPDQGRGAWWAFAPVAAAIAATLVWIILCLPPAT